MKGISSKKLQKQDAKFVDVYHSNQGEFGTLSQLGHVDFYVNGGGPFQPYCSEMFTRNESASLGGEIRAIELIIIKLIGPTFQLQTWVPAVTIELHSFLQDPSHPSLHQWSAY